MSSTPTFLYRTKDLTDSDSPYDVQREDQVLRVSNNSEFRINLEPAENSLYRKLIIKKSGGKNNKKIKVYGNGSETVDGDDYQDFKKLKESVTIYPVDGVGWETE